MGSKRKDRKFLQVVHLASNDFDWNVLKDWIAAEARPAFCSLVKAAVYGVCTSSLLMSIELWWEA